MNNNKQSMKNNPQQNENNNAKHQFSNTEVMTFSQQTEFLKTMSNNKQTPLQSFLIAMIDLKIGKNFHIEQHQDLKDAYEKARTQEEKIVF